MPGTIQSQMNAAPRRMSTRRILGFLLAISLIVALATYYWLSSAIDRRWAAMERRVAELVETSRSASSARPALRGPALPGNAWEHYEPALAGFRRVYDSTPGLSPLISEVLSGKPKGPLSKENYAKLTAVLDALQPDFGNVVRGSSCAEGQYPWDWGRMIPDISLSGPVISQAHFFLSVGLVEARRRVEMGDPAGALELLLAFMAFGRDVGDNGLSVHLAVGCAMIRTAGDEVQAMLLARKFDREQLLALERSLNILDRDFLRYGPALRNEQIAFGNLFLRGLTLKEKIFMDGLDPRTIQTGWRYGYSNKALQADAFFRFDEWCGRLSGIDSLPFPELLVLQDEIAKEGEASPNPWAVVLWRFVRGFTYLRECHARLRLLRSAALYRAGGELPALSDPCGTVLLSSRVGGKVRIWSVGRDGVDDGGAAAKDLVLDLD